MQKVTNMHGIKKQYTYLHSFRLIFVYMYIYCSYIKLYKYIYIYIYMQRTIQSFKHVVRF